MSQDGTNQHESLVDDSDDDDSVHRMAFDESAIMAWLEARKNPTPGASIPRDLIRLQARESWVPQDDPEILAEIDATIGRMLSLRSAWLGGLSVNPEYRDNVRVLLASMPLVKRLMAVDRLVAMEGGGRLFLRRLLDREGAPPRDETAEALLSVLLSSIVMTERAGLAAAVFGADGATHLAAIRDVKKRL